MRRGSCLVAHTPPSRRDRFLGKGVSYCATCDGALYRDREVVVAGLNQEAVEEAQARDCWRCRLPPPLTARGSLTAHRSPAPHRAVPDEVCLDGALDHEQGRGAVRRARAGLAGRAQRQTLVPHAADEHRRRRVGRHRLPRPAARRRDAAGAAGRRRLHLRGGVRLRRVSDAALTPRFLTLLLTSRSALPLAGRSRSPTSSRRRSTTRTTAASPSTTK